MFTLGIDYGTNSVRALIVRYASTAQNSAPASPTTLPAPQGILLDPKDHHLARQHPADYLYGLEKSVRAAVAQAEKNKGFTTAKVIGLGVDTTGSSPIPVDAQNVPLALVQKMVEAPRRPMLALERPHFPRARPREITALAAQHRPQFIAKCGNTYSSEWFWSKILHCRRRRPCRL